MPGAGLIAAHLVLGEQPASTTLAGLALVLASLTAVSPSATRKAMRLARYAEVAVMKLASVRSNGNGKVAAE
jgi:hypothetical protein